MHFPTYLLLKTHSKSRVTLFLSGTKKKPPEGFGRLNLYEVALLSKHTWLLMHGFLRQCTLMHGHYRAYFVARMLFCTVIIACHPNRPAMLKSWAVVCSLPARRSKNIDALHDNRLKSVTDLFIKSTVSFWQYKFFSLRSRKPPPPPPSRYISHFG